MLTLPPPRAIIFDWDNTLVDTWPIIHDALNATLADMGRELWPLAQTKARVSKSMRDSFPLLFGAQWEEAGERYRRHYRARHLDNLQPLPLAQAVLERVHEMGLFSVVVSNKLGVSLRKEVAHLGWYRFFQTLVGADDAAHDKPHEAPVYLAFHKSHIAPGSDVWFIGDSETDLECARNTGCTAILYGDIAHDHPDYSPTHYRGFPYIAHVRDHAQTLTLLDL